jgi:hypothetical protein
MLNSGVYSSEIGFSHKADWFLIIHIVYALEDFDRRKEMTRGRNEKGVKIIPHVFIFIVYM